MTVRHEEKTFDRKIFNGLYVLGYVPLFHIPGYRVTRTL
ncbi:hypothetical protein TPY_1023 [Sulfobacillus acidophilus TPY]|nr:hypothetical protein TPY_1023 [Sulfobacillus acidophilus TPY]